MTKPIPAIYKYMTTSPHTIGREQTLVTAQNQMRDLNIRHLPVLHGGQIVGLISDRDIELVESLKDVDPNNVLVMDAMSQDPFTVDPETPLDEVCNEMAEHKYGSAIVMQNNKVVGIFTTVDALKALSELLHTRLAK